MSFSPLQKVQRFTFPNGLRVFLKEDHAWPLVSAQAWVRVGSMDEAASQAGISHVIEHMVFKGTAHYAAAQISRWVEKAGGALNAETSREYTHYYIDVPSPGARQAVALLGELLHRARFDPREWKKECPVILEEIKRRNDDPDSLLWDLLSESLFEDPALSRPVIGSPESVAALTRETLYRYYRDRYSARRCTVVVAGDFKTREMLAWLKKAFRGMPAGPAPEERQIRVTQALPRHVIRQKPVRQSYVAYGFPTPPGIHPDHEALDLAAAILGDGRSSRLVRALREEKQLAWSISASNLTHEGPGLFTIFAECDPARRKSLSAALAQMLERFWRFPPGPKEIARAKNMIQTSWLQSFETFHSQAATVGLFAMENQLERLENYLPRLLKITPAHLRSVIDRYFNRLVLGSAVIEA